MAARTSLDPFRLDPDRLPRRVELELPAHLADQIARCAAATGRSASEIVLELLDRGLSQQDASPPDR
ncbi:MAG: ribbon-helix-helix protein, CopG family [Vulcanococcus sp.]